MADFDDRFEELWALAYRVAFRILGDREDAADVAQESLARVAVNWPRVSDHAPALTATIAGGRAIDVWRRQARASRHAGNPVARTQPADDQLAVDDRAELVAILRGLPSRQRHAVVLRYVPDLSEDDTAAALGCSPGTIKQHTARGLRSLRAALSSTTGE